MAVPAAAVAAAAAGLRVRVAGPLVTIGMTDLGDTGGAGSFPALASALVGELRRLTGEVRVLVVRIGHCPPPAADLTDPAPRVGEGGPASAEGRLSPAAGYRAWRDAMGRVSDRSDLISVAVVDTTVGDLGLAVTVACDLRVLAADARFRLTWARDGFLPAAGAMGRLVELLGYANALDLCLTGRELAADEAARIGLAQRVLPRELLDEQVGVLVAALLAVPRDIAAEVKALMRGARRSRPATRSGRLNERAEDEAWERVVIARSAAGDDPAAG
ncbi:hypothetical protein ThrDRAFT_03302 [Frankia casuarinae]|jgi:hypothetical protein|uniref:Enoyl-CoA hydratase n=1 Tax=Frankia casuarinae (strain DSM 45818 / CECT 9043 / HFP020203 / CcI3) TaxID=106370 RepID=Q2JCE1_FRACC|nr:MULTISPECIES: enoyl-CoA hydratase/isomerase family protein [Frankia]ABD11051.1 Enoyl-CoA hydratase [Frankia casuarinae]ETA00939.1 hypothetical protein CcI6DRAFT_03626 [Frankia sp. CcI6]EYT91047.1 hypothetical protein ThrDRAFT_03302 [Frankia casuarinae]KDA41929.1 hypothetical protein BMG523Draft_03229 [Frankia sp. BMG5.23]KFB05898.1 enoyl-CoA hydratase/isomerase family protein [Frankia sp. Allo2]